MTLKVKLVDDTIWLNKILQLQQANHKSNLSENEMTEQGFVTVMHTYEQLLAMHSIHPSIIVVDEDNNTLAGYALVMPKACASLVPVLVPAFESFSKLSYRQQPLDHRKWYLMGQICIEKNYRGLGVFQILYQAHKNFLAPLFDCCITTISTSNLRSISAHKKVGFNTIHEFTDATDSWITVLWDWQPIH